VCKARPEKAKLWQTELSMFAGWGEDFGEVEDKAAVEQEKAAIISGQIQSV
jgi:hypothetical protein